MQEMPALRCSVTRLFSMCGRLSPCYLQKWGLCSTNQAVFANNSQQSLCLSVVYSCLGKTNGSTVWYISIHSKLFTAYLAYLQFGRACIPWCRLALATFKDLSCVWITVLTVSCRSQLHRLTVTYFFFPTRANSLVPRLSTAFSTPWEQDHLTEHARTCSLVRVPRLPCSGAG